jgi:hypothetical protein
MKNLIQYWTNLEEIFLIENYLTQSKEKIMLGLPNRSWDSIVQRARRLKIGNRRHSYSSTRKYYWDFDYFEKINTSEKAYWLGFIYADGSVTEKTHTLRIGLIVEAERHLNKFAKAINFSGNVKGPFSNKDGTIKNLYTIALHHPKMYNDLANKGVVPNKTYCVKFPFWINKDLLPHFVRGLFDGDGTISKKTTKYKNKVYETPSFGFSSKVEKFCNAIADVISDGAGVDRNKVVSRKHNGDFGLNYQGTPALRIRDWMYKDATVWMECKKDKFYSHDYSLSRPQDKQHQTAIIDSELNRRAWKRLSEYKGYHRHITLQCDKNHIWTTKVSNFKNGCLCPHCSDVELGKRMTEIGKNRLSEIFANRGWELVSEYSGNGYIQIKCNHGKVFSRKRSCVTRDTALCDCDRSNTIKHGLEQLTLLLLSKGWKLISEYDGGSNYVCVECQHGKRFKRLPMNIKETSKCDCDKLSSSGVKGVYPTQHGKWQAKKRMLGKEISLGTFLTKEEAAAAITAAP